MIAIIDSSVQLAVAVIVLLIVFGPQKLSELWREIRDFMRGK